jgi:hypothetical protein
VMTEREGPAFDCGPEAQKKHGAAVRAVVCAFRAKGSYLSSQLTTFYTPPR